MKLNKFGYLLKEGFKSVFTHGFMSFASVTIVVACLVIMGSFALVTLNINGFIAELESQNQVVAFVDETLSEEQAAALQPGIENVDNVASCLFVTRETAMEEFSEQYEDSSLFSDIDSSVFRNRFVIYLDDIAYMAVTRDALMSVDGIAKVNAYDEVARGFVTVRNVVSATSLVLVVILVIVSVFIMANTIKLTTFGRRDEIAIMKIVGAGNSFIRCPFIVEGLALGLIGGIIAFFMEWGIYQLICDKIMAGNLGNIVTVIPFASVRWALAGVYLAVGFLVGAFGGSIAIRNYLKV